MKRIKTSAIILYFLCFIAWLVSLIFLKETVIPLALAINLLIEAVWNVMVIFSKPRYDGHLVFVTKEDEKKEIYRFELYDPPEDWPEKNELIIKVESKNV